MIDEQRYTHLADAVFRRVQDALTDVDVDEIDSDFAGDVLTITFKNGVRCVLNTQRPARQMWLAAKARAWHFSYDADKDRWFEDKHPEAELFSTLATIIREQSGRELRL
jgi:CyaY protein